MILHKIELYLKDVHIVHLSQNVDGRAVHLHSKPVLRIRAESGRIRIQPVSKTLFRIGRKIGSGTNLRNDSP